MFSPKRGLFQLNLSKNFADSVFHLPLEEVLAVKAWTANVKRDGRAKVKWDFEVCRLLFAAKNLMLNVPNNPSET